MFLLCARVSAGYGESDYKYFLYTCIINAVVGSCYCSTDGGAENKMSRRDGYCGVTLSWVFFYLFGMLPFYFSGSIDTITMPFFETMSGFTTTGATILDDIESLSPGMLFWRSLTQWIGGLGIVFFTIAILPIFTTGGVQLFSAESTGGDARPYPSENHVLAQVVVDNLSGIDSFGNCLIDVWGHEACLMPFASRLPLLLRADILPSRTVYLTGILPYIEYEVAIFMIVSSINFSLFLMCLRRKSRSFIPKMKSYTGFWRQWVS